MHTIKIEIGVPDGDGGTVTEAHSLPWDAEIADEWAHARRTIQEAIATLAERWDEIDYEGEADFVPYWTVERRASLRS